METLQLTKLQARQAIEWYEYANKYDLSSDIETEMKRNSNIVKTDLGYMYVRKQEGENGLNTFEFPINTETMQLQDILKINGEVVSIGYLKGFLNDLTDEEQKQALENMYLGDIEKYASERTGIDIKFKKELHQDKHGTWSLELYTDNLIEHAGICKAMLRKITATTWGDIGYYIDKYTGEQKLSTIRLHFSYEHQDGGSNGHEFGKIRFNENTGNFEGYNYDLDRYEVL